MLSNSKRKVKIVCTLGPSSSTLEQISRLIEEGMDVARLNFSHGTHEFHRGLIQAIREASRGAASPSPSCRICRAPSSASGILPKGGLELKAGRCRSSSTPKAPRPASPPTADRWCRSRPRSRRPSRSTPRPAPASSLTTARSRRARPRSPRPRWWSKSRSAASSPTTRA